MTIAIGVRLDGAAVICADTKVTAADGATSNDTKMFLGISRTKRMYGLADASEDAYAAKMLGADISSAISSVKKKPFDLPETIKKIMQPWYSSYRHIQPPQVQFIVAYTQEGWDGVSLFYCEPPSTVAYGSPIAIGKGSRAVDPLLGILAPAELRQPFDVKSAILKLTYLMHIAKRDEGSACGGQSQALVISAGGSYAFLNNTEMEAAEHVAKELDEAVQRGIRHITSGHAPASAVLDEKLREISESYKKLDFASLRLLERTFWKG